MASKPDILAELPWLTPSPRKTRKAKAIRHAKSLLLLSALAAPLLFLNDDDNTAPTDAGASGQNDAGIPAVIDAPFAPKAFRPLTPTEAAKWNGAVPETAAVQAATPFAVGSANAQSLSRSLQCMTAAIYYEAGNEPVDGQRAVAQVVLNRMRSPAYPHSICGVVYQGSERKTGCQFTFTCDGSLARVPSATGWSRASAVAAAALGGYVHAPVGWATHYHADYVVPYWAQSLAKLTTIGHHIFYGWKGSGGTRAGFTSGYAGIEPDVAGSALALAPLTTATDPARGIVRVTSAERPMIDFGKPDTAGVVAAPPGKSAAAEAAHPTVRQSERWVIGGSTTASRYGAKSAFPGFAVSEPKAETDPAANAKPPTPR